MNNRVADLCSSLNSIPASTSQLGFLSHCAHLLCGTGCHQTRSRGAKPISARTLESAPRLPSFYILNHNTPYIGDFATVYSCICLLLYAAFQFSNLHQFQASSINFACRLKDSNNHHCEISHLLKSEGLSPMEKSGDNFIDIILSYLPIL